MEFSKTRQRFGFGAADMASNLIWPMIVTYLTVYYTDVVGMNAVIVGVITLASKIIDAITDVLMGIMVDKTTMKAGKCRPYFLIGALPLALFAILTFSVPKFNNDTLTFIYAFITFNCVSTAYTIVNTPLSSILPSLSADGNERNVLVTFRMVMAAVGSMAVTTCATPIINIFGGNSNPFSYAITAAIFAAVAVLLLVFSFCNTREVVKPKNPEKITFRKSLKAVNKQYVLFVFIMFVFMLGFAIKQAGVVYYYTYVAEDEGIIPIQAFVTSISMIVGQLCIPFFCKHFGKKNSFFIMSAISLVGNIIFIFAANTPAMIYVGTAVVWYSLGFMMGMRFSILADVIDYSENLSGIKAAGILASLDSFIAKLTFGLNATIFMALLQIGGYIPNQTQTDFSKFCITFGFIGIPVLCLVVAALLMLGFKIYKKEA